MDRAATARARNGTPARCRLEQPRIVQPRRQPPLQRASARPFDSLPTNLLREVRCPKAVSYASASPDLTPTQLPAHPPRLLPQFPGPASGFARPLLVQRPILPAPAFLEHTRRK